MSYKKYIIVGMFGLFLILPVAGHAATFEVWLANFKQDARSRGISGATLSSAFNGVQPIQRVIELDRKQPEKKIGFDQYQKNALTPARVAEGRRLMQENWIVLRKIEEQYGVQAQYVVALWGMETSYGKNTGGFDIIASLATLAWEGRRGEYFKNELLKALKILQEGHVKRSEFKGSWAGAMGQVQFMPSSWQRFAVDYNGDGHKDIWTTREDAFASAANYLSGSNWVYGQRWGRQIQLPAHFNQALIGKKITKPLSEWSRLGIRNADGSALPGDANVSAFVVVPQGANGKAYLGYANLANIMKWNNSSYFALSVGQLADQIASGRVAQSAATTKPPAYHLNE
ncbi:MAG: lytic murein transglycosylase [Micavibrio aeruginosavorus]|uniref:Lytic murein transglycosylase n=1 Tax=Micavibrio aeruginosavorus TaxID=349221 RepID=A0A2W5HKR2_9BACT|nr:MAG: lytic murein transglycosylase [Micavibrio aeruginosavorus]